MGIFDMEGTRVILRVIDCGCLGQISLETSQKCELDYSILSRIIWSKVSIAPNFDQLLLLTGTYTIHM